MIHELLHLLEKENPAEATLPPPQPYYYPIPLQPNTQSAFKPIYGSLKKNWIPWQSTCMKIGAEDSFKPLGPQLLLPIYLWRIKTAACDCGTIIEDQLTLQSRTDTHSHWPPQHEINTGKPRSSPIWISTQLITWLALSKEKSGQLHFKSGMDYLHTWWCRLALQIPHWVSNVSSKTWFEATWANFAQPILTTF